MALLTTAKRKEYFKYLGLGSYNKSSILKFQKQYFTRKKDWDGEYGADTDNLLRHVVNVKLYTKNFKPEEFKCGCGGRYCTGYPTYMKPAELKNLQTIRDHYGKAMLITSGMRCRGFNNSLSGSSTNSKHLTGQAADFYMAGVTDTLARRKNTIAYLKKLPNFNWSYGNGWCSKNYAIFAPNMGNALHVDSTNASVSMPKADAINKMAIHLAWTMGTPSKKYKYKGGSPTTQFKKAWKKYYPNRKNSAGCHQAAMLVLKSCGYSTMPMNWSSIIKYMKKRFKQVKVNYKESQLQGGDIRIYRRKKSKGYAYHIMFVCDIGGKLVIIEANQSRLYFHVNKSLKKVLAKHNKDWLFRAK